MIAAGSGTVRVPMFRVFRRYDAPEILAIMSATLFVVCSFLAFYLF
jgi:hypothetical protein